MLKNRSGLLPLADGARRPHDRGHRLGGGADRRHELGLRRRLVAHRPARAGSSARSRGSPTRRSRNGDRVVYVDGSSQADAAAAAAAADVAVVVANDGSSEGADRPDLGLHPGICATIFCQNLPVDQTAMIAAVTAANPDSVVVLDIGAPVKMPWLDQAGAVLVPWYGGLQHGNALADVLYGGPSRAVGSRRPSRSRRHRRRSRRRSTPASAASRSTPTGLLVGYRAYDAAAPHTAVPVRLRARLHDVLLPRADGAPRRPPREGLAGRAQHRPARRCRGAAGLRRLPRKAGEPPRQLKGFAKVRLAPGASKRVTITLSPRAFAHWSTAKDRWVIKPGRYRIFVGPDSRTCPLRATVKLSRGRA